MAAKTRPRRTRRTAEEARAEILACAERQLVEHGPDALRLQDLAAEVGISHPAILHHFGTREGLIEAVVERAVLGLQRDLLDAFGAGQPADMLAMLDRIHRVLAGGQARLIGWLLLSGHAPFGSKELRAQWHKIVEASHAARTQLVPGASYEDTAFAIQLSAFALFAHALFGRAAWPLAGLPATAQVDTQFRAWLAKLLVEHFSS